MKKRNLFVVGIIVLGLCILGFVLSHRPETTEFKDIETLRVELREQVARGRLTELEAQVALAEAIAREKKGSRKRGKKNSKLERLGEDLKESMQKGEITEEEAKAKYSEAKETWSQEKSKKTWSKEKK